MKKEDVKLGEAYLAKITGKLVSVRIDRDHLRGGWAATNLQTNRPVRIKSALKLRGAASGEAGEEGPARRAKKRLAPAGRAARKGTRGGAAAATPEAGGAKPRGLLDAAASVLAGASDPMNCRQMVEAVQAQGLWSPGRGGKTPHATLSTCMSIGVMPGIPLPAAACPGACTSRSIPDDPAALAYSAYPTPHLSPAAQAR